MFTSILSRLPFFLDSERKLLCAISQERTYNGFGLELYARQVSHRFGKIGFDFFLNFRARRIALGAILHEKPAGEFTPNSLSRAMVMFHFSFMTYPVPQRGQRQLGCAV